MNPQCNNPILARNKNDNVVKRDTNKLTEQNLARNVLILRLPDPDTADKTETGGNVGG